MTHPSFDIISQLGQSEFCRPDIDLLKLFKDHVWDMRVYIPGDQIDLPDHQVATHFSLTRGVDQALPVLPLYLREAEVGKARADSGFFAARFNLAVLFAESNRADVQLLDGAASLLIPHDKLLELRDMLAYVDVSVAVDGDEAAQRDAMLTFASRARAYCARHAEVDMLHLATLKTGGGRSMLVGALSAASYAMHAQALQHISMQVFRPGWRFMLLDEARGHATLIRDLRKTPPCYVKLEGQGWWHKIKSHFETPALSLIGLKPA
jgi:hypothetical protein